MNTHIENVPAVDSPEWHTWRRGRLGASEIAAACGFSQYKSRYQLWLDKTGRSEPTPETPAMRWGKRHEQGLVEDWTEVKCYGIEAYPCQPFAWPDSQIPFHATPDAIVSTPEGEIELLECKTTTWRNDKLGDEDTDAIPHEWIFQAQAQLHCVGLNVCNFAVLIDGREMRSYRVERNDKMIRDMHSLCVAFWKHVETDEHPPIDWGDSKDVDAYIRQWKPYEGRTVEIPAGSFAVDHYLEYESLGKQISYLQEKRDKYKAMFLDAAGTGDQFMFPDGAVVTAKTVKSKGYFVQPKEYVRLSCKKAKVSE